MTDYAKLLREAYTYKELFPAGTRVVLLGMEDPYAPVPAGTRGTVDFVDDFGQIHMKWDNGRTLAIVPQVDSFRKLNEVELLNENLLRKADFLVDFFWAQHIYMSVEVEDNHLIARDDEGNEWKDAEIYDFGLNDCLCFNEDGSLHNGLAAGEPFVEQLKADAKEFGVEITSISHKCDCVDKLSIQAQNLYKVFVKELLAYDNPDDGFIPSNSSLIADFDFSAIKELLEAGIIQVRNCAGAAYELAGNEREKVLCNNYSTPKTVDEVLANAKQTVALTDTDTNLAVSIEKELD